MLPKSVFACLAVAAFVATAEMLPTVALARGFSAGNYPQPGTYNWPPYTETNCGYVWVVNSHRNGQWVYHCR
jgi:hypothetical protein